MSAGLVIVPFSGYGFMSVLTNASWALFAELPFLLVLWRFWKTWMHYASAPVLGILIADRLRTAGVSAGESPGQAEVVDVRLWRRRPWLK